MFLNFWQKRPDTKSVSKKPVQPLYLFNTLTKNMESFDLPGVARYVRMYNCGPTVYGRQHIGNLSMFVFTDALRKTLEYNGFEVKQTINITDFGHLTSDADEGEDKMVKGLKAEGLKPTMENMRALADKYTNFFLEDIRALNVDVDHIQFPRASDHIPGQIAMVKTLEEKGYAYKAEDGIYFDTSRFPSYGALGNIDLEGQKEGARVKARASKRNPADFILWKFDKKMGWDSPWGKGFPGWHIECSAMIRATLGDQIDIHTGGIEHISIHHNNEIAQSESATGKRPLSRFWLHRSHIQLEGGKIAKSKGNVVYLSDVVERGFHPLSLRYLFLGAHYRTPMNFTWEALHASHRAYGKLLALRLSLGESIGTPPSSWKSQYTERFNDDLDTAGALGVLWSMTKDESVSKEDLLAGLLDADRILGLNMKEPDDAARKIASTDVKEEIVGDSLPKHVRELLEAREDARAQKDFVRADELRAAIADAGFSLEDTPHGPRIFRQ